ncbi:MAG: aminoacyl-tRNA hydrolase [Deltaproteobacteria bacterium]|jgi:PTH1 family peptidyl-tRNA hydrolase|nr:aminoacyl-tRNA hydrolase [Deltaproteobacteria bacterium]
MEPSGTKLILGLGNPGAAYADTRHNVGFMALELFAGDGFPNAGPPSNFRSSSIVAGSFRGTRVILAWPQTYMNLSGHAARELVQFYKVAPGEDMLVVHDEMDLPPGKVKASMGGGSAGHKGIDSIREFVPGDFARLRIGIGRQPRDFWGVSQGNAEYVLSPFLEAEIPEVELSLKAAGDLMKVWIRDGLAAAQRVGNRKPPKPRGEKGRDGERNGPGGREGGQGEDPSGLARDGQGAPAKPDGPGMPEAPAVPGGHGGRGGDGGG